MKFVFSGDAEALARDPDRYRFRYEVRGVDPAGLLAAVAVAALLADRTASVAVLAIVLFGCWSLRVAAGGRTWPAPLMVFLVSPLVQHLGTHLDGA